MPSLIVNPLADAPFFLWVAQGEVKKSFGTNASEKAEAIDNAFAEISKIAPIKTASEIIMVSGPGNFTALRTGLGYVRGLSLGLNVPSRSFSIFELDCEILKQAGRALPQKLVRDAKGGRFYQAEISAQGALSAISLTHDCAAAVSFENIERVEYFPASDAQIDKALIRLAKSRIGESPAMANYIRPANADLPQSPPLMILPEHG